MLILMWRLAYSPRENEAETRTVFAKKKNQTLFIYRLIKIRKFCRLIVL